MTRSNLEWAKKFRRHPLAAHVYRQTQGRGRRICNTPEDVLGDRMLLLADYLWQEHTYPGEMKMPAAEKRSERLLNRALAALVAPPYLWPTEIMAAVAELPLPRHVISPRILPVPRSWHTFAPDLRMAVLNNPTWLAGHEYQIGACLVEDAGKEFVVTVFIRFYDKGELRLAVDAKRFEYGMRYPDDFEGDASAGEGKSDVELVLSMFAFLNSPYIPKYSRAPNRAARRQLGLGSAEATPEVTFVILRRPAARRASDEPSGTVDWKHRWVVGGHYRAQWYPSEQAHRVIWIAPYMKGPEDAPLIEHVYKVAR